MEGLENHGGGAGVHKKRLRRDTQHTGLSSDKRNPALFTLDTLHYVTAGGGAIENTTATR